MRLRYYFIVRHYGVRHTVPCQRDGRCKLLQSYAAIKNPLAKYLVVILVMATGIMLFSNVALRFEDDKLRKRLTIFITAFAFILTIPLTYVLIAMLPFHAKYNMADVENAIDAARLAHPEYTTAQVNEAAGKALGLSGFGNIMGVHTIYEGFEMWFKDGAFIWVVFVFMAILGVVFLIEPLAARHLRRERQNPFIVLKGRKRKIPPFPRCGTSRP